MVLFTLEVYLSIGDRRQRLVNTRRLSRHGEQRRDAQGNSGWNGMRVKPETDPRNDDQHAARYVVLDQVVGELAFKHEVNLEAAVGTCVIIQNYVKIGTKSCRS